MRTETILLDNKEYTIDITEAINTFEETIWHFPTDWEIETYIVDDIDNEKLFVLSEKEN